LAVFGFKILSESFVIERRASQHGKVKASGFRLRGASSRSPHGPTILAAGSVPRKLENHRAACAMAGGPFIGHPQIRAAAANLVPVDLFIPTCPPPTLTILDGLLRLPGKRGCPSTIAVTSLEAARE
jgi:hypothetical protein